MYTEEQAAIIAASREENVAVHADAGTGKTFTVGGISNEIGFPHLVVYFNTHAAKEAVEKLGSLAKPTTLHSLFLNITRRAGIHSDIKVDTKKQSNIIKDLFAANYSGMAPDDVYEDTCGFISAMGAGCIMPESFEAQGINALKYISMSDCTEEFMSDWPSANVDIAFAYWDAAFESLTKDGAISYDEMLCAPVWFNVQPDTMRDPRNYKNTIKVPKTVIVDEAQDLSALNHYLLSLLTPTRFHMLGDPNQAIYGWRGADYNSFDNLSTQFACRNMPMTINFRCSRAVVEHARTIVPTIRAHDGAPEGSVTYGEIDIDNFRVGDVILCRNNAPLVKLALKTLKRKGRVVAMNKGSDTAAFGYEIKRRWQKLRGKTMAEREASLDAWYNRRAAKISEARASQLDDIYECVKAIIRFNANPSAVDQMFGIDVASKNKPARDVVLSTGHRAKGREWNKVGIICPELIGHNTRTPQEEQQERNLRYVMYTRAKHDLIIEADNEE